MTEDHGLSREQLEALAKALYDEGAGPRNSIHSWRCEHPDLYGTCTCVEEVVTDALAPTVAAMLADAWPCANYRQPTTCLTAPSSETGRCDWCRTQAEAAEKRGEDRGRAEVAIAVAREAWKYGVHRRALSGPPVLSVTVGQMPVIADAALARHTATAAQEGTTGPLGAPGGSAGGSESPRASDGRTGPRTDEDARAADAARRLREVQERALGTCGEQHGGLDMTCQLRRGHDGPPEDWSAVAQERLA